MSASGTKWSDLGPRVTTAIVLVILGGIGIYFGGALYTLLLILALIGILWELGTIVLGQDMRLKALVILAGLLMFSAHLISPLWMQLAAVVAGGALYALKPERSTGFLALGALIIGASIAVLNDIRLGENGIAMTVWLLGIVAMSDIGAYFTGRIVGGPKLWPAISPGKTRSGALGGVAWAFLFAAIFALATGMNIGLSAVLAILLSVASMAGDLAQSAVKRSYGVKDSGTLLPGHGGLWDRFDGVIGAAVIALLIAEFSPLMAGLW